MMPGANAAAVDDGRPVSPSVGASGGPDAPRLLMILPNRGLTFVEADVQSLSRTHRVEILTRETYPSRRQMVPAVLRRLLRARYAAVLVWFAEPHDTPYVVGVARLLRTRTVVVVGGYEVTWLPALSYGALGTRGGRVQARLGLRAAHVVLPTSQLLADEVARLGRRHGVEVIHPGIDGDVFRPGPRPRERLVVTVATVSPSTAQLKGLDVFAQCARRLPDVNFAILGSCLDEAIAAELRALAGPNLTIVGRRLAPAELVEWYQRAGVYAQLSARESFGVALAEAMACGCAPVATNVGALPEVVGDAGTLVAAGDVSAAVDAIARGLNTGDGERARRRIQQRYAVDQRAERLLAAVRGTPASRGAGR